MRRSRRSTLVKWLPKTPRYVCNSSSTTKRRFSNSRCQRVWCGRMPVCSMSGVDSTMWPRSRIALRASAGVSPSYVNTPNR